MADSSGWWRKSSVEATHSASDTSGRGQEAYRSRLTENSKASTTWHARQQHGPERTFQPKSYSTNARQWSYTSPDSSTDGELRSSYHRYTGSQLTAKLRSASTARALQGLLQGHSGILSSQHLSAAFKALSVMHAPRDEVQSLLQEHLLPALNSMLTAAETAATATNTSTNTSTSTSKAFQHTSSSTSDNEDAGQTVVLEGRACAVILTSLLSLKDSMRPVQQQQAYQRHQAHPSQHYNITQLAADLVDVFLSPAVQATATPQAFCMVASAAAKLRLRSVSPQQLQQLLCGFLTAAADAGARSPDLLAPVHVSQTLWGVATLLSAQGQSPPSPDTQQMMCDAALLLTQQPELYAAAKPVELVNTLCAFAIAEASPPPGLVTDLLEALAANLDRAIPQDISRAMWAVARTNRGQEAPPGACLRALSALCRPPVLARVTSQDVSNALWGAANIQQQRQSGAGDDEEEPQGQQQGSCIDPEHIEALATKFMRQAEQRQVTQTDVSAMCWALAALGAQLPGDLMQQLFQTCMMPHILDQVDRDPTVSTGITNILWAAATLNKPSGRQHWRKGRQGQQQLQLLSTADLETLAGMLLEPRRLRHLAAADISITTSSLAHLGFSWTQQQLSALLQRFLEPGARSAALPKNFQNVLWGVIRMKQEAVLQQDGILQQLVQAWFASSGPKGLWSEADADPAAAANVLWAVAVVSKGEDTHEQRWLDSRSSRDTWKHARSMGAAAGAADGEAAGPSAAAASILNETCTSNTAAAAAAADGEAAAPAAAASILNDTGSTAATAAAAAAAGHRTQYVSKHLLQRLFDSFLQHRNLAAANTIDISTVMWAAAVLNQPLPQDDLQWLLSAFMQPERLEAASAMSIANMMYGLTYLQLQTRQKLQDQQGSEAAISLRPQSSTTSSNSSRGRQGLSTARVGAQQASSGSFSAFSCSAQQESVAPVLAALSNQLLLHIPDDVTSEDLSAALLALTRAYVVLQASNDSSSSRAPWVLQHQRLLQEALWDLLQQMLLLIPSQDQGSSSWTSAPSGVKSQESPPCQHSDSSSSGSSGSSPVAWTVRKGLSSKVPAVGSFSQQLLQDRQPEPCSMHTLVDAVWACDSMGVAPPDFLAAVCRAALQPWGSSRRAAAGAAAAGAGTQQPAVQQLPWSELVVLLEKLASLNWLSPVVWECALQPLLAACPAAPAAPAHSAAGHAAHLSTSLAGRSMDACRTPLRLTQEQELVLGRATGVVPRLCWAAAVGNCQSCRSLVVLLCRAWACCLAQQHEQELGQQQGPGARSNLAVAGSAGLNGSSSSSRSMDCGAGLWSQQVGRESLCQLWQVHMWLQDTEAVQPITSSSSSKSEISSSSSSGLLGALSAEQLQLCEAAWKEQVGQVRTSRLQLGVAEVMGSIPGISNVQLEGLTPDGCFSVDVMAEVVDVQALAAAAAAAAGDSDAATAAASISSSITGRGRPSRKASQLDSRPHQPGKGPVYQLAIEADGPSHFVLTSLPSVTRCETGSAVLRGEARLRSRSLAARGYVVLRVSYLDWKQQQQHCKQQQREQQQQEGGDSSESASSKEGLADMQAWLAGCVCEAIAMAHVSSDGPSST